MNIISQLLLKFDKMDQDFKNFTRTSSTTEQVYGVWRPVTTKKEGILYTQLIGYILESSMERMDSGCRM